MVAEAESNFVRRSRSLTSLDQPKRFLSRELACLDTLKQRSIVSGLIHAR